MRLIDADAFVKWIERQKRLAKITTIMAIQETPAIDAVPVVRCKDCKHAKKWKNQYGYEGVNCYLLCADVGENHFCNHGERKE